MKLSAPVQIAMAAGLALVVFPQLAGWLTRQTARAAGSAAAGAVKGAGEAVGIPDTDAQKCAAAKRACSAWEAAKFCPAPDFLSWLRNRQCSASRPEPPTKPRPGLELPRSVEPFYF